MEAVLVLENGMVWKGKACGARGTTYGEVVFNTGMSGYQEVFSDPSYAGQMVVMTYPLIGNYGIYSQSFQSNSLHLRGLILNQVCDKPSHWQSEHNVERLLEEWGIIALEGIDTRMLTRVIRDQGTIKGILSTEEMEVEKLVDRLQSLISPAQQNLVETVSTKYAFALPGNGHRVVVLDCGVRQSIIRHLRNIDCQIHILPYKTKIEEIMALKPHGVLLSSGPGDPTKVPIIQNTIRELIGKLPIFGICLGYQILGLTLGAKVFKLPFGHRGSNHPVKDLHTNKCYITAQNHGYAIEENTLPPEMLPTFRNLHDHTIEGIRHSFLPVSGVQFHPEAGPGPHDLTFLFQEFSREMDQWRQGA